MRIFISRCKTLKKNTKILTVLVAAIVVIAGVYVVLGNNSGDSKTTITIQGSTTVAPIMLAVQEIYEEEYGVTLNITANGSGSGAAAAANGTADIGMLSRDLKTSEVELGLEEYVIGVDGIAVIVSADAGVTNLTLEQVAQIYSGEITNWSEVGGNDLAINVFVREDGSGTRDGFETALENVDSDFELLTDYAGEFASTNAILSGVEAASGAIGYISVGYTSSVDSSEATILSIDGVSATVENVKSGDYPIQRNLVLATLGEATGAAANLIDWILSSEGQAIIAEEGYIPINDY